MLGTAAQISVQLRIIFQSRQSALRRHPAGMPCGPTCGPKGAGAELGSLQLTAASGPPARGRLAKGGGKVEWGERVETRLAPTGPSEWTPVLSSGPLKISHSAPNGSTRAESNRHLQSYRLSSVA